WTGTRTGRPGFLGRKASRYRNLENRGHAGNPATSRPLAPASAAWYKCQPSGASLPLLPLPATVEHHAVPLTASLRRLGESEPARGLPAFRGLLPGKVRDLPHQLHLQVHASTIGKQAVVIRVVAHARFRLPPQRDDYLIVKRVQVGADDG